ncbi:formiminoglutamate deiminase [Motilibacter rhizosphaerae]|uniref:Formiminoglutamate deiminase n=1 Tax=Motilibacter rhizosphaerae TaxID=598652 RepID=A0A4Q7NUW4_9ACTN|nr:formiminoglutamate deiminase [Motilibacter rhizosphaerae]
MQLDHVLPGAANAHSHCFHRALRGRTHADGGTFWTWREQMYAVAERLTPDSYEALAAAVFAEMLVSGWTAVGEFHYVHHRADGTPYAHHDMELALARAASSTGIRLTLLDTCYLRGGPGVPLGHEQRRFSDATVDAWLARWHALRDELAGSGVVLGAAVHSVRAVEERDIARVVAGLPADVPLHAHVSEQPREDEECRAEHGCSPTQLLDRSGALSDRFTAVHATHVTPEDIDLLACAGAAVALCPSTEADLGDGIGPFRALADAGVRVALGSDQNAVIDPYAEARMLEHHARLESLRRGQFSPAQLEGALTAGHRALGRPAVALEPGAPADLVELRSRSVRTAGSDPGQLVLSATAADVGTVVVGGEVVARDGRLSDGTDPAGLLLAALQGVQP